MTWLRKYLTGLIAACIMAALCRKMLSGSKHFTTLANMVIGIFLLLSVLSPILEINWNDAMWTPGEIVSEFNYISEEAQNYQQEALRQRIKTETEAYIWSKAKELAMAVELEVLLDDVYPFPPCQVKIYGHASPYARNQLSWFIQEEIGIPKEAQIWTSAIS